MDYARGVPRHLGRNSLKKENIYGVLRSISFHNFSFLCFCCWHHRPRVPHAPRFSSGGRRTVDRSKRAVGRSPVTIVLFGSFTFRFYRLLFFSTVSQRYDVLLYTRSIIVLKSSSSSSSSISSTANKTVPPGACG